MQYYIGISHPTSQVPEPLASGEWWTPPDHNGISHLRPSWDHGFGPNAVGWLADVVQRIVATGPQHTQNFNAEEIAAVPRISWEAAIQQFWDTLRSRRAMQMDVDKYDMKKYASKINSRKAQVSSLIQ